MFSLALQDLHLHTTSVFSENMTNKVRLSYFDFCLYFLLQRLMSVRVKTVVMTMPRVQILLVLIIAHVMMDLKAMVQTAKV